MPRIVAGVYGGRRLVTPRGRDTRPTADRVREALFSALGDLTGRAFLDLYAGSGAIGLEAASRGAAPVAFVEHDAGALDAIRANVKALGVDASVHAGSVEKFLAGEPDRTYDVVYIDPPYAVSVEKPLQSLVFHGWLAEDATVVVERATRDADLTWPAGIEPDRSRRYGEGTLWYGRRP